jgi:hypothetical protein
MVRRQNKQDRRWRVPWLAAACVVLLGLALSLHAGANGDLSGDAASVVVYAAGWSVDLGHHDSAPGHGGAGHCRSGPGCGSAVALLEVTVLGIGKANPVPVHAGLFSHQRNIRPPLHPPNLVVQG